MAQQQVLSQYTNEEILEKITKKTEISGEKKYLDLTFKKYCNNQCVNLIISKIQNGEKFYTLRFMGTQITDDGIISLVDCLKTNKDLHLLDLQLLRKMTDVGLKKVADMLVENDTLKYIYLGKPSGVTAEGARYLAQKVAERERKFPDLKAEISFSEVGEAHDTKENPEIAYDKELAKCRETSSNVLKLN